MLIDTQIYYKIDIAISVSEGYSPSNTMRFGFERGRYHYFNASRKWLVQFIPPHYDANAWRCRA